jgi:nicotinamide mononucleotide transporter
VTLLEAFAAALGVLAVYLTARQNPWCWPLGLVMVLLYAWVFFEARLYANTLLQGVFAITQLYGWWQWRRPASASPARTVSLLAPWPVLRGLLLAGLGSLLLGYGLAHFSDAAAPWSDAALTAFSLLAQLWMAHKRVQCWPLWLLVDVAYVALFIDQALYLTALLYGLFCLLALHGWRSWQRALNP